MHELAIEHTPPLQLAKQKSAAVESIFTVINLPAIDHLPWTKTPNKIIDLIKNRQRYYTNIGHRPFYSIEISPSTIGRPSITLDYSLFAVPPLFTAITWLPTSTSSSANNANDATASEQTSPAISLARSITTVTLSHVSCHHLTESRLNDILNSNNDAISNILALRGDVVDIAQPWRNAVDLVMAIRKRHSRSSVCIAVAGYPQVHPEAETPESDLRRLKEKVNAGADFVITQTCFSASMILGFIKACRAIGIKVPIVPGLYVPFSFVSLVRMCEICQVKVPIDDFRVYKELQVDVAKFQRFALERMKVMLEELFTDEGVVDGVHFFTLNRFELVKEIVQQGWFQ